jgi:3-dehydroshikimate dehydratase
MLIPGLVSVTFRHLSPLNIVRLVEKVDFTTIEWGGDVHVPHGDRSRAREVRKIMSSAGLSAAAYGSYYRVGESENQGLLFEQVLATAVELEAPTIRVWAGAKSSAQADSAYREKIVEESWRIADMAAAANISISYEFHAGTLTDSNDSALALLRDVSHDHVYTSWQPQTEISTVECSRVLEGVLPRLTNVHVFHWLRVGERRPLIEGYEAWKRYLRIIRGSSRDHHLLLEFVRHDEVDAFYHDAQTLKQWLETVW